MHATFLITSRKSSIPFTLPSMAYSCLSHKKSI
jgi:hypothetical protein